MMDRDATAGAAGPARTSSPPRRVCYVEGNIDGTIGGSYFSLLFLTANLDRRIYEPIVIFSTENALLSQFRQRGVRTVVRPPIRPVRWAGLGGRLAGKAVNLVRAVVWQPLQIARLLRRERIDLLHLNNSVTRNHSWMIAALLTGVPCVTHERGINDHFSHAERALARRLDAVICISRAVQDNFAARGLSGLRLVRIHNGLDAAEMRPSRSEAEVRAELGVSTSTRLVGIVGNIKPWKGQALVIAAMERLTARFPDLVCLLIGDTPSGEPHYRAEIDAAIASANLTDRVIITGYRRDVANYVNVLEIQIHASVLPEPFGRVLLEGMALRKPLVASNAGGVPEIVVDGETGLLFESGSVEALTERLAQLLADPARGRVFGEAGRRRLERDFSIEHNVTQTQALYDTLLQP